MFSLSLQSSAHRIPFQRNYVRSSAGLYSGFNLAEDRSLGFGSTARNLSPCSDSVSLRLRDSYPLTSLHTVTRRLILQKARHHPTMWALTACRSTVSGSLSLPSRGPFHLSLTVLCAIGSRHVSSLGGWSPLLPAGFLVSRRTQALRRGRIVFGYGAFTRSGRPSQCRSPGYAISYPVRGSKPALRRLQPRPRNALELARGRFGLFPVRSPLLGESRLISFPAGT